MADEHGFGGERVGLHIDVRSRDLVDEAGLADVGITGDDERAIGRVDGGQTRQMLANLLQIRQRRSKLSHARAHAVERKKTTVRIKQEPADKLSSNGDLPAQCSTLELLASVQTITELDKVQVIFRDVVHNGARSVDLTQGELVVISRVQNVHQVREKGVDILRNERQTRQLQRASPCYLRALALTSSLGNSVKMCVSLSW